MEKKKLIIIVILIAAVVGYFIWKNNKPVSPATIPLSPTSPGTSNDPGSSLPSPVSVPHPVSQQGTGIITPVGIPSVAAVFAPGTSDAQSQGSGSTSDPLGGMPSGFQTWVNSLGPQNRSRVLTLIPQMTSDEINLVNNIVVNNLWGNASVSLSWNAFTRKYSLPAMGNFSNFQAR